MGAIQRLYQATEAAQELEAMLLESQGDITELEGQFDILTRQSGSLSSCIDDVLSLVRDIEARAEAREAEAKRLKERAARDEKIAAWMKSQVLRVMQSEGMKKIETERWRATVAMPGGKAALEIVDEVPEEFTTTVTKIIPDNERIRAALETGTLPFARIVPKEPYLKVS